MDDEAPSRRLGVPAIVCVAFVAIELLLIALLAFLWVPSMKRMIEEFDRASPLPPLTHVVFTWWWSAAWAAALVGLTGVAIAGARTERRRVALLAFAMVLGAAGPMLTLWGLYQPIFELAGKIKS